MWWLRRLAFLLALALVAVPAATANEPPAPALELEFLEQQIFPTATFFEGTQFGGLSSITYDHRRKVWYAISDDQVNARFYTLRLGVKQGRLGVEIAAVTTLRDAAGVPFAAASLDPEGLTLTDKGTLVITSEGFAARLIDPWVREFALDGRQIGVFHVPAAFSPDAGGTRGVRQNLGFESAAVTQSGRYLFTGAEAALVQDGPPATVGAGSPARLLRYDLRTRALDRQFVYWTEPIAEPPVPPTAFAVNGLVELLPLDKDSLVSMERSFSVGAPDTGNTIELFHIELGDADDVNGFDSLALLLPTLAPAEKTPLLNLDTLGIPLDNVEGMAFGPDLPDGRRSLVLVSDNNFSPAAFTQFLLFAVG
jgi:3-phytase